MLIGFYSKSSYEILGKAFCILPKILSRVSSNNASIIKTLQIESFRNA